MASKQTDREEAKDIIVQNGGFQLRKGSGRLVEH